MGKSNELATNVILNSSSQVFLCGPRFCGKKHLALKVAKNGGQVFFINMMSDSKIVF